MVVGGRKPFLAFQTFVFMAPMGIRPGAVVVDEMRVGGGSKYFLSSFDVAALSQQGPEVAHKSICPSSSTSVLPTYEYCLIARAIIPLGDLRRERESSPLTGKSFDSEI